MDDLRNCYDGGQDGGHYPNPLKHFVLNSRSAARKKVDNDEYYRDDEY
jgi:hypothetical protein